MKVCIGIVVTSVLSVMMFSLVVDSTHLHGHHYSGGCRSSVAEQTLCWPSITEHISAWQSMFFMTVPLLVLVLSFAVRTIWYYTRSSASLCRVVSSCQIVRLYIGIRELVQKQYTFDSRFLQSLFADGILHTKRY